MVNRIMRIVGGLQEMMDNGGQDQVQLDIVLLLILCFLIPSIQLGIHIMQVQVYLSFYIIFIKSVFDDQKISVVTSPTAYAGTSSYRLQITQPWGSIFLFFFFFSFHFYIFLKKSLL